MSRAAAQPHDTAHLHVAGASEFVDDRPAAAGEVFVTAIYSPVARGRVTALHADKIARDPDFLAFFTAKDVAHNRWGTIFQDQPLIADGEVNFAGEVVALLVTTDRRAALRLRRHVALEITSQPAILSIREARDQASFIGGPRAIERDFSEEALANAPRQLTGTVVLHGADHFYLESQAAVVYPLEDGQLEVHSSSQHPTEVQHVVAHALGLPDNAVVAVVKRMGGGFGGKESQAAPIAAYAALVAHKLGRPARIIVTKDDDMIMTGKRNPFELDYRVGFANDGELIALDVALHSDGGAYADLSTSIMERAMLHCDNAYFVPHMRVRGQVCRTNYHPHTAFRGFGGPKGVAMIEHVIERVAHHLGLDPLDVRRRNLYGAGGRDRTHYGQVVENNMLAVCMERAAVAADYVGRRAAIDRANATAIATGGRFLRGLSLTPVKFGISFTTRFLNQGNAYVIMHRDGTLQVATGATEMGQGVNARIATMVAGELALPRHAVRMMPTRTDKNANTSPTAASSGTDINGAAALLATRKLKQRLAQFASQLLLLPPAQHPSATAGLGTQPEIAVDPVAECNDPNAPADTYGVVFGDGKVWLAADPTRTMAFGALINEAYLSRVSLADYAHYRIPGIEFNKLTGQGRAFLYFTQGAALNEVRVDRLTGEVKVELVHIEMDLGRPVDEGLDIGQVTGAFVQGMGWVTTEALYYSAQGLLLAHSPSTYKIPSIQDMPRTFTVNLVENQENYANVRGTKAVGEPPLLLALGVWTAIANALTYLPRYGRDAYPVLDVPATQERILRAIDPEAFAAIEAGVDTKAEGNANPGGKARTRGSVA